MAPARDKKGTGEAGGGGRLKFHGGNNKGFGTGRATESNRRVENDGQWRVHEEKQSVGVVKDLAIIGKR